MTIDSITIADPTSLIEDEAYVSPVPSVDPSILTGIVDDGPPPDFYAKGQTRPWEHRRPAVSIQVPPTRAGTDVHVDGSRVVPAGAGAIMRVKPCA